LAFSISRLLGSRLSAPEKPLCTKFRGWCSLRRPAQGSRGIQRAADSFLYLGVGHFGGEGRVAAHDQEGDQSGVAGGNGDVLLALELLGVSELRPSAISISPFCKAVICASTLGISFKIMVSMLPALPQ
jgi:hypothetical protein